MTVSLKHKFTSAVADGGDTNLVQPSNWNDEHDLVMATDRLLGRTTAGTGAAEEISVGSGLTLSAGTLSADGGGAINGIFWENGTTVSTDYTITADTNAGTFGPVTVDSGVTVTIPSGSTWTIV
jgi:hypothetical protein